MQIRFSALILLVAVSCSEGKTPSSTGAESPLATPSNSGSVTKTAAAHEDATMTDPSTTWTLRFADGSGNQYTFTSSRQDGAGHLSYDPVTPEESSSGTYSGGDPFQLDIDASKNAEVWNRARTLQADTSEHAAARGMGTGLFQMTGPDGETRFVLKMGAKLSEFVSYIEGLGPAKE